MHFHPILLVQADSLEDAKIIAGDFIDCKCGEHTSFDYGGIAPDNETEWNKPLLEVKEKLPADNHIEEAERMLAKASLELEQNNYDTAGYYYQMAGELFSQCLNTGHPVFNIRYHDYSTGYGEGWYAVEADLHF